MDRCSVIGRVEYQQGDVAIGLEFQILQCREVLGGHHPDKSPDGGYEFLGRHRPVSELNGLLGGFHFEHDRRYLHLGICGYFPLTAREVAQVLYRYGQVHARPVDLSGYGNFPVGVFGTSGNVVRSEGTAFAGRMGSRSRSAFGDSQRGEGKFVSAQYDVLQDHLHVGRGGSLHFYRGIARERSIVQGEGQVARFGIIYARYALLADAQSHLSAGNLPGDRYLVAVGAGIGGKNAVVVFIHPELDIVYRVGSLTENDVFSHECHGIAVVARDGYRHVGVVQQYIIDCYGEVAAFVRAGDSFERFVLFLGAGRCKQNGNGHQQGIQKILFHESVRLLFFSCKDTFFSVLKRVSLEFNRKDKIQSVSARGLLDFGKSPASVQDRGTLVSAVLEKRSFLGRFFIERFGSTPGGAREKGMKKGP